MADHRIWNWTKRQKEWLGWTLEVLTEYADYLPVTLRQIFYRLVGKGYIENTRAQYEYTSIVLKWARINGHVPWDCVIDDTRAIRNYSGWWNMKHFIDQETEVFLTGYQRDLWQDQENFVECWIEKRALGGVFGRTAQRFSVSMFPCSGYSSITALNDYRERTGIYDKRNVICYFGDLDPTGRHIPESLRRTFAEELGVEVDIKEIALTINDVLTYQLPHKPEALKKARMKADGSWCRGDPRAEEYMRRYGEVAVELDALPVDVMKEKLERAIMAELTDRKAFNRQVERWKRENAEIERIKHKVTRYVRRIAV